MPTLVRVKTRLVLAALGLALPAALALAQPRRLAPDDIAWSTFVSVPGQRPQRQSLAADPGAIDLGTSPWGCGFGRPAHAAISDEDWSVQRVLGCQRGEATVSATASCRVRGDRIEEHAATLNLGTTGEERHITVTLSCARR